MTKEELIKIYSAYLPYNLKLHHESHFKGNKIIEFWGLKNCSDYPISEYCDGTRYGRTFQEVKPILYDLSYLTKEIEHNGERFIPLHKILEVYNFDLSKMDEEYILSFKESLIEVDMSFKTAQMLLEWHFNVFNIPEGDYINKATLNK